MDSKPGSMSQADMERTVDLAVRLKRYGILFTIALVAFAAGSSAWTSVQARRQGRIWDSEDRRYILQSEPGFEGHLFGTRMMFFIFLPVLGVTVWLGRRDWPTKASEVERLRKSLQSQLDTAANPSGPEE